MLKALVWYFNAGFYPLLYIASGGAVSPGREPIFIAMMLWCVFCYFRALDKTIRWMSEE